jgi:hypothetical protein
MPSGVKGTCCKLAEAIGPERTAVLDEELQRTDHRSFHKLAASFSTNHMAVKRHKQKCLGLGKTTAEAGTGAGTPEHRSGAVPSVPGGVEHVPEDDPEHPPPRARAPEVAIPPGTQADRVSAIKLRIADGKLVPGDVPRWAEAWGLSERTVRAYVAEAYRHVGENRGTVDERRILAMGMWEFQIELCDTALENPKLKPLDRALLLKERASAITGWCKAAGVFDDSTKISINIAGNPVFVAVTEALFTALAAFPEAHAAARAALGARLQLLRQAPMGLPAGPAIVEAKQEAPGQMSQ